jgi:hypothetical protein
MDQTRIQRLKAQADDDIDSALCWTLVVGFALMLAATIDKAYSEEPKRHDTASHHQ